MRPSSKAARRLEGVQLGGASASKDMQGHAARALFVGGGGDRVAAARVEAARRGYPLLTMPQDPHRVRLTLYAQAGG